MPRRRGTHDVGNDRVCMPGSSSRRVVVRTISSRRGTSVVSVASARGPMAIRLAIACQQIVFGIEVGFFLLQTVSPFVEHDRCRAAMAMTMRCSSRVKGCSTHYLVCPSCSHLILASNSVNPNAISTENTMVQYVLPPRPVLGAALPLSMERSALTIHRVEKASVVDN